MAIDACQALCYSAIALVSPNLAMWIRERFVLFLFYDLWKTDVFIASAELPTGDGGNNRALQYIFAVSSAHEDV